jgi:hypothetical protein
MKLLPIEITYKPRSTIKSQVLLDFIVEWTKAKQIPQHVNLEYWLMYFDGSMTVHGLGFGVVLIPPR